MKRNKKIISVLLAVIMLLSALPLTGISAFAQDDDYSFTELLCNSGKFCMIIAGKSGKGNSFTFLKNGNVNEISADTGKVIKTYKYTYHEGTSDDDFGYVSFDNYKLYDNPNSAQAFRLTYNENYSGKKSYLLFAEKYMNTGADIPFYNTSWTVPALTNDNGDSVRLVFSKTRSCHISSKSINNESTAYALNEEVAKITPKTNRGVTEMYIEAVSPTRAYSIIIFNDGSSAECRLTRFFNDVDTNGWYYQAVMTNVEYGIMSGYGSGPYFGTNDSLKRQDFVCMMANLLDADVSSYANQTPAFKDVQKGSYYAASVNWAVKNNIISGYQNGKFGVGDPITREQVCVILYRMEGNPAVSNVNGTLAKFSDQARISSFARDAVAWAVQQGIIKGMSNGTISSTTTASRAQIAAIMYNLLVSDS